MRLYALLVDEARFRDRRAFCSNQTRAKKLGVTVRTVRNWLRRLERDGMIVNGGVQKIGGLRPTVVYEFPRGRLRLGARRRISFRQRTSSRRAPHMKGGLGPEKAHLPCGKMARERASWGRRRQWRSIMGEVVPFDGGTPERKAASDGQSLFTAMMDGLRERGVVPLRSQVAIAVRHGKAALEDGVAPALVLHCCLLAYRQGHPELAGKIILDATLVTPGDYLTREQYWRQRDKHALRTSTDPDAVAAREWEESQRDFQKRVLDPALEAMFGKTPGGEIERRET